MRFHKLPSRHFRIPELNKTCPGAGAIYDIHVSEVPEEEIRVLAEPFVAFRYFIIFHCFFLVLFFKNNVPFFDIIHAKPLFLSKCIIKTFIFSELISCIIGKQYFKKPGR